MRQLARFSVLGTCRPSAYTVGVKPRSTEYQSERFSEP